MQTKDVLIIIGIVAILLLVFTIFFEKKDTPNNIPNHSQYIRKNVTITNLDDQSHVINQDGIAEKRLSKGSTKVFNCKVGTTFYLNACSLPAFQLTHIDLINEVSLVILDGNIRKRSSIIRNFSYKVIGDWYIAYGRRIRNGKTCDRKEIPIALMEYPALRITSKENKEKSVQIPIDIDMNYEQPLPLTAVAFVGETYIVEILNGSERYLLGKITIKDPRNRVLAVSPGRLIFSSS